MLICDSNCVWDKLSIVRCKHCITNSGLSKCHNVNIPGFMINLDINRKRNSSAGSGNKSSNKLRTLFQNKFLKT